MTRNAIIGIGNPLRRDDGIGIHLLQSLMKDRSTLPPNLELIDAGTGGMNLVHLLARFDVVLIIDAVHFGIPAGESRLLSPDEVRTNKTLSTTSTHMVDVLSLLRLSEQLHELPQKLYIFGVQPIDMAHGTDLSQTLQRACPRLLQELKQHIQTIFIG